MEQQVEVKLLNYVFRFKRLKWEEEFAIKFPKNKDQTRIYLAYALVEVSGLKIESLAEATRVISALPTAIASRVFRIYKGQLRSNRNFTTAALFKAPEPAKYKMQLDIDEEERDKIAEQAQQVLSSRFSEKEIKEATEISHQIADASKLRGAVKVPANHAE
jgi:alpha-amylase/alpha-mannosidase (GH57 family)